MVEFGSFVYYICAGHNCLSNLALTKSKFSKSSQEKTASRSALSPMRYSRVLTWVISDFSSSPDTVFYQLNLFIHFCHCSGWLNEKGSGVGKWWFIFEFFLLCLFRFLSRIFADIHGHFCTFILFFTLPPMIPGFVLIIH